MPVSAETLHRKTMQLGGYVRAVVKRALMLQPPEGDDLPACLCADYQPENVRFCRESVGISGR
jgi:hypothetical protein